MADEFVNRAFEDASKASIAIESELYAEIMQKNWVLVHIAAAKQVGVEKINALCDSAIENGQGDTLADYTEALLLTGFHLGYKTAMERK